MIAPTLEMVADLNARARTDRIAAEAARVGWPVGVGAAERGTGQRRGHRDHQAERADVVDGRHRLCPEQLPLDRQ